MVETHPEKRLVGYARVSTYGQTLDGSVAKPSAPCDGRLERSRGRAVSDFKGRHFGGEIVLWAGAGIAATASAIAISIR
jgi:hypothetical protein